MANTYTQIHIQVVCVVKFRQSLIDPKWKIELYKYITAIIQNQNHKVIIINGVEDHIHILIGMRPTQSLADLMKMVKGDSSKWINSKKLTKYKFSWQEGYGGFSYSKSHVTRVINYIKNQEEHHKKETFKEEYLDLLKKFEVEYDPNYLFEPLCDIS